MRTHLYVIGLLLSAATKPALGTERDVPNLQERLDTAVGAAIEQGLGPAVDDAVFLRRTWLDLAGKVPPVPAARQFLDDRDPQKRAKLVDRLLASDDFAAHWGHVLAGWLIAERPIKHDGYDGRVLHAFLTDGLREGTSYGQLVHELVTGAGASDVSGAANFLLRYDADPPRLAAALGKNVLGVTVQCAQCHDHPFAAWKQDDFWGLAASFARLRKMDSSGGDDFTAVLEAQRGELTRPSPSATPVDKIDGDEAPPKPVAVKPRLLSGKPIPANARRRALADWIVTQDNPYFARNLVNRVWEQLFGHRLVRTLDDAKGAAQSPAVLSLLADDFSATGYDLKRLLRTVVLSQSYAQATTIPAQPGWARPASRPLAVDQLFASIAQATGYDGPPAELEEVPRDQDLPESPDAQSNREEESDDDDDGPEANDRPVEMLGARALTLQRALVLINGEFVRDASRFGARVAHVLPDCSDRASRLEWAFLATLSRRPTPAECALFRPVIETRDSRAGLEDVFWVLLNSAEFLTNH